MPYSTEYKEERYVEISKYMDKISILKEGEVLAISANSLKELTNLRWLFLDYFHITGAAGVYAFKFVGLNLLVGKTIPPNPNIVLAKTNPLPFGSKYDEMIRRLIISNNPREEFCKILREEKLSFKVISLLAGEYARTVE